LKFFKISLTWFRISILCITVIVTVILISRQPGIEKLLKKMMTPSLISSEQRWALELEKVYTLCAHREVQKSDYQTLQDLQTAITNLDNQENQDVRLIKASGHFHIYAMSIKDYCINCREHQFLGINQHNVAVIRGTPENPGPVMEETTVKIEALPRLELEDLRKGIPFRNGNEKLQLIEGLKGLSAN
jgi:hypothetical protein